MTASPDTDTAEPLGWGLDGVSRSPSTNARRRLLLTNWLADQRANSTAGRWLLVWSDTKRRPLWTPGEAGDVGRLSGAQTLAVIEGVAAEDGVYLVRRIVRAGADIRTVELWVQP